MFRKLAALVAPTLLVLGACAQEGDPGALEVETGAAAVSALRAAPESVADAGTAQFEMVMEVTAEGESFDLVATGAFDDAAGRASVAMDLGPLFEQMAPGAEMPPGFDADSATMEMVFDGDTAYLRSPLFGLLTGTNGWMSMTAEQMGTEGGGLGVGSTDPTALLDSLRGVAGDPEVVGQEEVRGVATTHYRATMSLADALDQIPEADRAEAAAAFEQLGDLDSAELPVDVWIDEDDLPRRMRMDMGSMLEGIVGGEGSMTMTLELFDYGEPVDIEVPAADEVTPLPDVMGDLGTDPGS